MNFEKRNNIYKNTMVIIVTAIITFILTSGTMYTYYFKNKKNTLETKTNYSGEISKQSLEMLTEMEVIKSYLNKHYLGNMEESKMIDGAIKGFVDGVGDPYTEYLTQNELEDFMVDVVGDYVGIGIYMSYDKNENIIVLMPIEGSPAEELGIKTGDIITKVNDEECKGKDLDVVASKIKGEPGTKVKLEILRENENISLEIERRKVEMKYITSKVIDNDIGYIQIMSFSEGCAEKFKQELNALIEKNIKSLIIDVRDNGGGIVLEVLQIAELFTNKDNILMIEVNKEGKQEITKSGKNSEYNLEVVILGNENSASASEILIAALMDNEIAKFVGQKTYGKGVMQELIEISTGGALKTTIEEFLTPKGNKINEVGIKPNVEIELQEDSETDTQLEKAIELLK